MTVDAASAHTQVHDGAVQTADDALQLRLESVRLEVEEAPPPGFELMLENPSPAAVRPEQAAAFC